MLTNACSVCLQLGLAQRQRLAANARLRLFGGVVEKENGGEREKRGALFYRECGVVQFNVAKCKC